MLKFTSEIKIINGNPYVRPPDKILQQLFIQAGKDKSPITVKGEINGAKFKQSLVRYQGDWRLYVNIIMAKAAHIGFKKSISEIVGTNVDFEIEYDNSPPTFKMLPFIKEVLDKNVDAKKNWDKLIPSRQKEILRYFSWLKSEEARERNVSKLLSALTQKETRFMARTWKDGR